MPTFIGSVTLSAAAVATAASMAFPPAMSIRSPACAASGWLVTTIPLRANTGERLCASHPSARSPRTAPQAGAWGVELQSETSAAERTGPGVAPDAEAPNTITPAQASAPRIFSILMSIGWRKLFALLELLCVSLS
jgi:hypothetical protein